MDASREFSWGGGTVSKVDASGHPTRAVLVVGGNGGVGMMGGGDGTVRERHGHRGVYRALSGVSFQHLDLYVRQSSSCHEPPMPPDEDEGLDSLESHAHTLTPSPDIGQAGGGGAVVIGHPEHAGHAEGGYFSLERCLSDEDAAHLHDSLENLRMQQHHGRHHPHSDHQPHPYPPTYAYPNFQQPHHLPKVPLQPYAPLPTYSNPGFQHQPTYVNPQHCHDYAPPTENPYAIPMARHYPPPPHHNGSSHYSPNTSYGSPVFQQRHHHQHLHSRENFPAVDDSVGCPIYDQPEGYQSHGSYSTPVEGFHSKGAFVYSSFPSRSHHQPPPPPPAPAPHRPVNEAKDTDAIRKASVLSADSLEDLPLSPTSPLSPPPPSEERKSFSYNDSLEDVRPRLVSELREFFERQKSTTSTSSPESDSHQSRQTGEDEDTLESEDSQMRDNISTEVQIDVNSSASSNKTEERSSMEEDEEEVTPEATTHESSSEDPTKDMYEEDEVIIREKEEKEPSESCCQTFTSRLGDVSFLRATQDTPQTLLASTRLVQATLKPPAKNATFFISLESKFKVPEFEGKKQSATEVRKVENEEECDEGSLCSTNDSKEVHVSSLVVTDEEESIATEAQDTCMPADYQESQLILKHFVADWENESPPADDSDIDEFFLVLDSTDGNTRFSFPSGSSSAISLGSSLSEQKSEDNSTQEQDSYDEGHLADVGEPDTTSSSGLDPVMETTSDEETEEAPPPPPPAPAATPDIAEAADEKDSFLDAAPHKVIVKPFLGLGKGSARMSQAGSALGNSQTQSSDMSHLHPLQEEIEEGEAQEVSQEIETVIDTVLCDDDEDEGCFDHHHQGGCNSSERLITPEHTNPPSASNLSSASNPSIDYAMSCDKIRYADDMLVMRDVANNSVNSMGVSRIVQSLDVFNEKVGSKCLAYHSGMNERCASGNQVDVVMKKEEDKKIYETIEDKRDTTEVNGSLTSSNYLEHPEVSSKVKNESHCGQRGGSRVNSNELEKARCIAAMDREKTDGGASLNYIPMATSSNYSSLPSPNSLCTTSLSALASCSTFSFNHGNHPTPDLDALATLIAQRLMSGTSPNVSMSGTSKEQCWSLPGTGIESTTAATNISASSNSIYTFANAANTSARSCLEIPVNRFISSNSHSLTNTNSCSSAQVAFAPVLPTQPDVKIESESAGTLNSVPTLSSDECDEQLLLSGTSDKSHDGSSERLHQSLTSLNQDDDDYNDDDCQKFSQSVEFDVEDNEMQKTSDDTCINIIANINEKIDYDEVEEAHEERTDYILNNLHHVSKNLDGNEKHNITRLNLPLSLTDVDRENNGLESYDPLSIDSCHNTLSYETPKPVYPKGSEGSDCNSPNSQKTSFCSTITTQEDDLTDLSPDAINGRKLSSSSGVSSLSEISSRKVSSSSVMSSVSDDWEWFPGRKKSHKGSTFPCDGVKTILPDCTDKTEQPRKISISSTASSAQSSGIGSMSSSITDSSNNDSRKVSVSSGISCLSKIKEESKHNSSEVKTKPESSEQAFEAELGRTKSQDGKHSQGIVTLNGKRLTLPPPVWPREGKQRKGDVITSCISEPQSLNEYDFIVTPDTPEFVIKRAEIMRNAQYNSYNNLRLELPLICPSSCPLKRKASVEKQETNKHTHYQGGVNKVDDDCEDLKETRRPKGIRPLTLSSKHRRRLTLHTFENIADEWKKQQVKDREVSEKTESLVNRRKEIRLHDINDGEDDYGNHEYIHKFRSQTERELEFRQNLVRDLEKLEAEIDAEVQALESDAFSSKAKCILTDNIDEDDSSSLIVIFDSTESVASAGSLSRGESVLSPLDHADDTALESETDVEIDSKAIESEFPHFDSLRKASNSEANENFGNSDVNDYETNSRRSSKEFRDSGKFTPVSDSKSLPNLTEVGEAVLLDEIPPAENESSKRNSMKSAKSMDTLESVEEIVPCSNYEFSEMTFPAKVGFEELEEQEVIENFSEEDLISDGDFEAFSETEHDTDMDNLNLELFEPTALRNKGRVDGKMISKRQRKLKKLKRKFSFNEKPPTKDIKDTISSSLRKIKDAKSKFERLVQKTLKTTESAAPSLLSGDSLEGPNDFQVFCSKGRYSSLPRDMSLLNHRIYPDHSDSQSSTKTPLVSSLSSGSQDHCDARYVRRLLSSSSVSSSNSSGGLSRSTSKSSATESCESKNQEGPESVYSWSDADSDFEYVAFDYPKSVVIHGENQGRAEAKDGIGAYKSKKDIANRTLDDGAFCPAPPLCKWSPRIPRRKSTLQKDRIDFPKTLRTEGKLLLRYTVLN